LYQVEYAGKAVSNSGTAIGICCKDGVVLGVEKIVEYKMLESESNRRIFNVDKHVGMVRRKLFKVSFQAVAGYYPDSRQLVKKARSESVQYQQFYGSKIPGHLLCDRLSSHVHLYTLYWHLRPFGSSVLLGSYDHNGPALYMIEPSGTSWVCFSFFFKQKGYHACAVGRGKQNSKAELEKLKPQEMTCVEAVKEIAKMYFFL
jgi:20S proteasome subunit alpha 7